jgi:uridine phosphorylase
MNFYRTENNEEEKQILQAFNTHTQLNMSITAPYITAASGSLLKLFVKDYHQGITVTCPGFYGPQGRVLRLGLAHPDLIDQLTSFRFGNHRIANFEMESSAIYGLGRCLGHNCVSLNVIVANRIAREFSKDSTAAIESLIKNSLDVIASASI